MAYYEMVDKLKEEIVPLLNGMQIQLVELNIVGSRTRPTLQILIDKAGGGISLNECAEANRLIGELLDSRNIIDSRYVLEVSSPGVDRPLKTKDDFSRCIGKEAVFYLGEPVLNKIELKGIIEGLDAESVLIRIGQETVVVPLGNINKAKQIIGKI